MNFFTQKPMGSWLHIAKGEDRIDTRPKSEDLTLVAKSEDGLWEYRVSMDSEQIFIDEKDGCSDSSSFKTQKGCEFTNAVDHIKYLSSLEGHKLLWLYRDGKYYPAT